MVVRICVPVKYILLIHLPQEMVLLYQNYNQTHHLVLRVYWVGLDPRLRRAVGSAKDHGMASLNHNAVFDFLIGHRTVCFKPSQKTKHNTKQASYLLHEWVSVIHT